MISRARIQNKKIKLNERRRRRSTITDNIFYNTSKPIFVAKKFLIFISRNRSFLFSLMLVQKKKLIRPFFRDGLTTKYKALVVVQKNIFSRRKGNNNKKKNVVAWTSATKRREILGHISYRATWRSSIGKKRCRAVSTRWSGTRAIFLYTLRLELALG